MKSFKPSGPFTVPIQLFIPTVQTIKGTLKKVYPTNGILINGTFRTFGGTEKIVNNLFVVDDTGTIETWYRPDITSDCRLRINNVNYEILGSPENIQMRNQYLLIKVRAIKGGA